MPKPLSTTEMTKRAQRFVATWRDASQENADAQSWWNDLFDVFGVDRRSVAVYERRARRASTGEVGRIDVFMADVEVVPVTKLRDPGAHARFLAAVGAGKPSVVYFQTQLGGEIPLAATPKSPELVEVLPDGAGGLRVGRYGILEIQTMDYHGSYRAAVTNLRNALGLHGADFHAALQARPDWAGERIEGPNISNVFKRTFYQMLFKFQIGAHPTSAGSVFAIPKPVWDSCSDTSPNPSSSNARTARDSSVSPPMR